jgi:NAD(P)H-hydrate repair Nnr-like enzyme with NAD(P)H-hydrate dehydratase domain
VVASPDGTAWANPTGTAALATAGTGDVLAGLLVSLLAGGVPADRAAIGAAFLHGLAGRAAAKARGGGGAPVTAPDVANALPGVLASLS